MVLRLLRFEGVLGEIGVVSLSVDWIKVEVAVKFNLLFRTCLFLETPRATY